MAGSKKVFLVCIAVLILGTLFSNITDAAVIGYPAIGRGMIPCDPMNSHNARCKVPTPANRYKRGCSPIDRCRRKVPSNSNNNGRS